MVVSTFGPLLLPIHINAVVDFFEGAFVFLEAIQLMLLFFFSNPADGRQLPLFLLILRIFIQNFPIFKVIISVFLFLLASFKNFV